MTDTRPMAGPQEAVPEAELWRPETPEDFILDASVPYDPMRINSPRGAGDDRTRWLLLGLLLLVVLK